MREMRQQLSGKPVARQLFTQLPGSGGKPFSTSPSPPPSGSGLGASSSSSSSSSSSDNGTGTPKIEHPKKFRGESDAPTVVEWLKSVLHAVHYHTVFGQLPTEERRVVFAAAMLDGTALDWWLQEGVAVVKTVDEFVTAMKQRFLSRSETEMAIQRLRALTQGHDTVAVYAGKVHQLLYLVPNMDMESRIQHFTAGLNDETRKQVIFHGPKTLVEAVQIAERAEVAFGASARTRTQPTTQPRAPQKQLTNVETGAAGATPAPAAQTSEAAPAPSYALAATTQTTPPIVNPGRVANWRSTAKCFHCTENGHVAADCPEKKAGKPARCYKCHKPGHISKNCPGK